MVDADVGFVGREGLVVRRVKEEEMLLHLLVERHSRLVVQVAHDDKRLLPLLCFFHDKRDACHAVLVSQAEVRTSHDIMFELSHQEHPRLFTTGQRDAMHAQRLLLAEDADAVLASLELNGWGKGCEHLSFASYLFKRVESAVALRYAVHLLYGSHIGMCLAQDTRLPRMVYLTIETRSVLYIIRCKANSSYPFGLQGGREDCTQKRNKQV